jgi:hypothetical protein
VLLKLEPFTWIHSRSRGDITDLQIDSIVNAAKMSLEGWSVMHWRNECNPHLHYRRWWWWVLPFQSLRCLMLRCGRERVDGAIHRAAGPGLYEECLSYSLTTAWKCLTAHTGCAIPFIEDDDSMFGIRCETGDARITKGYDLPA